MCVDVCMYVQTYMCVCVCPLRFAAAQPRTSSRQIHPRPGSGQRRSSLERGAAELSSRQRRPCQPCRVALVMGEYGLGSQVWVRLGWLKRIQINERGRGAGVVHDVVG